MIAYFQVIRTAILYKKKTFEMLKPNLNIFLDLRVLKTDYWKVVSDFCKSD